MSSRYRFVLVWLTVLCCAILFSLFTVYAQVKYLRGLSPSYLEVKQVQRHEQVILGKACNPWQYRVLPEYLLELALPAFADLGLSNSVTWAFLLFRVLQNTLIFLLAAAYYRRLGLTLYVVLVGLSLLAWGMSWSVYDSDLQFSTYFDLAFYLLAGLVMLHNKHLWIIPITVLAALNRETSGLIPFMLIAYEVRFKPKVHVPKKTILIAGASLALYAIAFSGLRLAYGPDHPTGFYGQDQHRPLDLFWFNVSRYITWVQLFATMSLMPILALISWQRWPRAVRAFSIAVVPVWFSVHFFAAQCAESRSFLVPQALIFIPGVLFGVVASDTRNRTDRRNEDSIAEGGASATAFRSTDKRRESEVN